MNYQENRYDMLIVIDAIKNVFNTKQQEKESLQDFTKQFRVAVEVLESHLGGPFLIQKAVVAMNGYVEMIMKRRRNVRVRLRIGYMLQRIY